MAVKKKIEFKNATEDDNDILNALISNVKKQSEPLQARLEEIQIRFARKNNFVLTDKKFRGDQPD